MNADNYSYSMPDKIIHMGLAIFGITAYLTAEGAEHSDDGFGYQLHVYLGLTLMAIVLLRIFRGYTGSADMRFSSWPLFSTPQWVRAVEDLKNLVLLKMPERGKHEGLAGLLQASGLVIFAWMGATGTALYFLDENINGALFEMFEEAHEIGESLIPLFLILHVGAVIAHTLTGSPVWRRIWSFNK